jgi:hypothetical protein
MARSIAIFRTSAIRLRRFTVRRTDDYDVRAYLTTDGLGVSQDQPLDVLPGILK